MSEENNLTEMLQHRLLQSLAANIGWG